MGNLFATYEFLEAEKKTWVEHRLQFDADSRNACLPMIDQFKDGQPVYLSFIKNTWGNVTYEHWFVTNKSLFLEFGAPSVDIYSARVTIKTQTLFNYPTTQSVKMNSLIRDRMRHVLGMCNYSLCMRNCEHVANYVFRGRWVSSQMDANGGLLYQFRNYLLGDNLRIVNTFPACIRPHVFELKRETDKIYSFIDDHPKATRFDYYLDYKENTFNVAMIGPTGVGKSHLINVLFNQQMCDTTVSHNSVTREIYFIRGNGDVYNEKKGLIEAKEIVIADTVGLCDTQWEDTLILDLIKGRINANWKHLDLVCIVFETGRLEKPEVKSIKNILKWLNYDKNCENPRFWFICTHAESAKPDELDRLRGEAVNMLDLEPHAKVLYVAFSPEDDLNAKTKARVISNWTSYKKAILLSSGTKRIEINKSLCIIL